jgi:hypothetical protein
MRFSTEGLFLAVALENRMRGAREAISIAGRKLIDLAFHADARSVRQYEEVKGRIARALVVPANPATTQDVASAINEQRLAREKANRESVALEVAVRNLPAWYRCWLQWCGEKPLDASKNLNGLRNAIVREHAEESIGNIKRGLRL